MPRVRFTDSFNWDIPGSNRRQTVAYKAGDLFMVTTPCALAAIEAGKAVRIDNEPGPGEAPAEPVEQAAEEPQPAEAGAEPDVAPAEADPEPEEKPRNVGR